MSNKNTYWKDLKEATQTTAKGLGLTWEHFQKSIQSLAKNENNTNENNTSGNANAAQNQSFDSNDNSNFGIVTNLYPHEMMPIPDNGRYKLHNEIEDCIVCNKCVEVCPVNCIEIDAIRGTEQVGTASDGSPIRFYAAKFDIDMAKCCFCGLCTVVCPTECLTMTKEFDFSETDITKMNYEFGNLKENEIIEKQKEWDDFQAEKASQKTVKKPIVKKDVVQETESITSETTESKPKPVIKIKLPISKKETESANLETTENKPKPVIKIKLPSPKKEAESTNLETTENKPKPVIKIKLPSSKKEAESTNLETTENKPKPVIKIKLPSSKKEAESTNLETTENKPKPVIKIKLPSSKKEAESTNLETTENKPKPVIKIKLPISKKEAENKQDSSSESKDME